MQLRSYLFIPINYFYNALFFKNYTFLMDVFEDLSTINYALEIFTNIETQLGILFYILIYKLLKLAIYLYNKKIKKK